MPVSRMESGKRPGKSSERNTAIHYWVPLDVRKVIDRDEAMPYQLRINPKRYYRQTEQDKHVGSTECYSSARVPLALARARGMFLPGYGDTRVFSVLRSAFSHALARLSNRLEA